MKLYLHVLVIILVFSAPNLFAKSNSFEHKIIKIEKDISNTYDKISVNNQTQLKIKNRISEINTAITSKRKYLAKRFLAQRGLRSYAWLFALDLKHKSTFHRNLKIFNNLNLSDITELHEYKLSLEELDQQQKLLNAENENLLELSQQLKTQEQSLKRAELERTADLDNEKDLDHFLRYKNHLALPLDSVITTQFGQLNDSTNQYSILVKGLVMDGQGKKPIHSFGPGQVIFRDHIPYWGDSIIITHKGGYYSVYAGIENATVNLGDSVLDGQIIATSNNTDFYFELRHLNIPLNPLNWIRKEHD